MTDLRHEAPASPFAQLLILGRTEYSHALDLQGRLHASRVSGAIGDVVLLTEHQRVLTLGRGADERFIRVAPEALAARAINVVRTERGGDVTYHGPGQLVAYPIMDLRARGWDIRHYVRLLEQTAIHLLAGYGLRGTRRAGAPGVWVNGRKIGSVGVYVRRWVTMHGIALNLEPDLDDFALIYPCGLIDVEMTSVAALLGPGNWMDTAWTEFPKALADVFGVTLELMDGPSCAAGSARRSILPVLPDSA